MMAGIVERVRELHERLDALDERVAKLERVAKVKPKADK
jgi:hypothetical protein